MRKLVTTAFVMTLITGCGGQSTGPASSATGGAATEQPSQTIPDPAPASTPETEPKAADTQSRACLIDGTFNLMGQIIRSKDCMQSSASEDEAAFKQSCEQLANTSAMMGGQAGKITYSEQCPRPAQGVCKNYLGGKRDAYYYARSGDDLRDLPSDCAQGGGSWSSGS